MPYRLYSVVQDGIVLGCSWEIGPADEGVEYVLMTFDNSPAYVNGRYDGHRFYPPEEING